MDSDLTTLLRRGVRAHEAGDLASAEAAYREILGAAPRHADANHLMGLIRFQAGDVDAAVALMQAAIAIDGAVPLYHGNLGRAFKALERHAEAAAAFRDAVRLAPDVAAYHADLAAAMLGLGDAEGAAARALQALDGEPDLAEAHLTLGLALQELRGPGNTDALRHLRRARSLRPDLAGAHLGIGIALHENAETEGAAASYADALSLNPNFVEAHCNLGNICRDAGDFTAAIGHYRRALALQEGRAEVWGNLGVAMQESGQLADALAAYDRSIALQPVQPGVQRNRAMALLAMGRFAEGWAAYEHRWQTDGFRPLVRKWRIPMWDGDAGGGRHLFVHAEQGLGDTLQFCRYIALLAERGMRVTLECPDVLAPLLAGLPGVVKVVRPGSALPPVDAHVPLLSLPYLLGTTPETIPARVPYLHVPVSAVRKWAALAAGWPAGRRIGIAWRGSPKHVRDAIRSPGLAPFLALAELEGTVLVSLQKDGGSADIAAFGGDVPVIDPTDKIEDFADTAGLMTQLDCIVSCDSAPLHLAGALGRPVVGVLPHVPEWRWALNTGSTPWYPGMTLVRQPSFGDWDGAFRDICAAI